MEGSGKIVYVKRHSATEGSYVQGSKVSSSKSIKATKWMTEKQRMVGGQGNKLERKVPAENTAESNRWTHSKAPQRRMEVFSDHAMQIAGNKTRSWWKVECTESWTITLALPISGHVSLPKPPGPQCSQVSKKEGKRHTSCHSGLAMPCVTLFGNAGGLCSS